MKLNSVKNKIYKFKHQNIFDLYFNMPLKYITLLHLNNRVDDWINDWINDET